MILGLDPSLASFGWAVVDHDKRVHVCGVIRTKAQPKKRGIRVMDSQCERTDEILRVLDYLAASWPIQVVVAEGPAGSKSVKAATALERAATTWQTWAHCWSVPRLMVTPGELKKAVCGTSSASKEQVAIGALAWLTNGWREHMREQHPVPGLSGIAADKREHVYDAIGAVIACWDSDVVRMARSARLATAREAVVAP